MQREFRRWLRRTRPLAGSTVLGGRIDQGHEAVGQALLIAGVSTAGLLGAEMVAGTIRDGLEVITAMLAR